MSDPCRAAAGQYRQQCRPALTPRPCRRSADAGRCHGRAPPARRLPRHGRSACASSPAPTARCAPPSSGTAVAGCSLERRRGRPTRSTSLDVGGGTGGFAVPLAELGHRVTVVDPSPDALAALQRRAAEAGVADRVRAVQGDAAGLARGRPSPAAPTSCSATASSSTSTTPAGRGRRCVGGAAPRRRRSACWSPSARARCWPGPLAGRFDRGPARRSTTRTAAGATPTRCRGGSTEAALRRAAGRRRRSAVVRGRTASALVTDLRARCARRRRPRRRRGPARPRARPPPTTRLFRAVATQLHVAGQRDGR